MATEQVAVIKHVFCEHIDKDKDSAKEPIVQLSIGKAKFLVICQDCYRDIANDIVCDSLRILARYGEDNQ